MKARAAGGRLGSGRKWKKPFNPVTRNAAPMKMRAAVAALLM